MRTRRRVVENGECMTLSGGFDVGIGFVRLLAMGTPPLRHDTVPFLALSATAVILVRMDTRAQFGLPEPGLFQLLSGEALFETAGWLGRTG